MIKTILFILISVIAPIAILLQSYMGGNWYSIFHSFSMGLVFGIISWTLFLVTLILACRIKFLEKIFGQDKLIILHKYFALFAIITGFTHVYFKLKFSMDITIQHITGTLGFSIIFLIAFFSAIIMSRSIFDRFSSVFLLKKKIRSLIRYSLMKFIHNGLPIALMVILFHILISPTTEESLTRTYIILATGIPVLLLWLYHKIIRPVFSLKGTVEDIIYHSPDLYSIKIRLSSSISLIPGQFFYFRFKGDCINNEEHPFTVCGQPDDKSLEILIKKEGRWTHDLSRIKKNSIVSMDGPYGKFTLSSIAPMLWIAGGVGITPFLARIRDLRKNQKTLSKMTLLIWTAKTEKEMPYKKEFIEYARYDENFSFIPVHTRESKTSKRIDRARVCNEIDKLREVSQAEPYLWYCGSFSLRGTVFSGAHDGKIRSNHIFYEEFSV